MTAFPRLIALGVMSDTVRSPLLPEVPTISEAGLPGYADLFAIWAPAGIPALVVNKLYSGVKTVLQNEAVQKQLAERGYQLAARRPRISRNSSRPKPTSTARSSRPSAWEKN